MQAAPQIHHSERAPSMHNPELRGLDQILGLADNGAYHPALLADLAKLVSELQDFSRAFGGVKAKGKISLDIAFTIDRFGQIDMEAQHKLTQPKAPKAKGIAWTTEDGALTPANPAQMRMDLRDVTQSREFRNPGASQD